MSDKNIIKLLELAKTKLEELKKMTKKQAILSLNDSGILTKKCKFTKAYAELEELVNHQPLLPQASSLVARV